jgi:hypothetical protein
MGERRNVTALLRMRGTRGADERSGGRGDSGRRRALVTRKREVGVKICEEDNMRGAIKRKRDPDSALSAPKDLLALLLGALSSPSSQPCCTALLFSFRSLIPALYNTLLKYFTRSF